MTKAIGKDARFSIADFAGEFHELEPWQRDLVETIAAIPPAERARAVVVVNGEGSATTAALLGARGDRIIIDDPHAGDPMDFEVTRRAFLDLIVALPDDIDPVIIMARCHDEPALKLDELERIEKLKPIRPREIAEGLAGFNGSPNRADRRAQAARARKRRG